MDNTHQFSDLDELIVNHVQSMARKVEELKAHEKFKQGSEDELRKSALFYLFLISFTHSMEFYRPFPEELCCREPC